MRLNLARIRTAHEHFEQIYPPAAFPADVESFRVTAPVSLAFDIHKDKERFRLVGRVATTLELPCSRCLEPLTWAVDSTFDLRYLPQSANSGEDEREIGDDDLSTAYYENDEIDLGQLMREQFYLVLPMKPLCRDDCLGLCPVCGANLNRTTCDCPRGWEDPRFAALKPLRDVSQNRH